MDVAHFLIFHQIRLTPLLITADLQFLKKETKFYPKGELK
jgi:hypothetical protein